MSRISCPKFNLCLCLIFSIAHCKSKDCQTEDPIKELFGDLKQKADQVFFLGLGYFRNSVFNWGGGGAGLRVMILLELGQSVSLIGADQIWQWLLF